MNAVLIGLVEAEVWYLLLIGQTCCQPPKFLMEEGIVFEGMNLLFQFLFSKGFQIRQLYKGVSSTGILPKKSFLESVPIWRCSIRFGEVFPVIFVFFS